MAVKRLYGNPRLCLPRHRPSGEAEICPHGDCDRQPESSADKKEEAKGGSAVPFFGNGCGGQPRNFRRFYRRVLVFLHDAKLNIRAEERVNTRKLASAIYRHLDALPTRASFRARVRSPIRRTRHTSDTYGRGAEHECLVPSDRSAAHGYGSNLLEQKKKASSFPAILQCGLVCGAHAVGLSGDRAGGLSTG